MTVGSQVSIIFCFNLVTFKLHWWAAEIHGDLGAGMVQSTVVSELWAAPVSLCDRATSAKREASLAEQDTELTLRLWAAARWVLQCSYLMVEPGAGDLRSPSVS